MGFSKKNYETNIRIEVLHHWHPDTLFAFTFPKRMPQPAAEAEARYLGVSEEERKDVRRKALIETVAKMVVDEPEGFDEFAETANSAAGNSLEFRVRDYFDDPDKPELEEILSAAYRAYRLSGMASGYSKSLQVGGAGVGDLSRIPAQTPT